VISVSSVVNLEESAQLCVSILKISENFGPEFPEKKVDGCPPGLNFERFRDKSVHPARWPASKK